MYTYIYIEYVETAIILNTTFFLLLVLVHKEPLVILFSQVESRSESGSTAFEWDPGLIPSKTEEQGWYIYLPS